MDRKHYNYSFLETINMKELIYIFLVFMILAILLCSFNTLHNIYEFCKKVNIILSSQK